ncbi:MAG: hypothetical protein KC586_31235, partial [Myxococcales bacterium]|nr:hypothetical protein [Myxococcales bacterium]
AFPPLSVEGGELVRLVRELPWTADVRTAAIRYVHTGPTKKMDEEDAMARLRETRSRLVAKLRRLAANDGDPRLAALVPERDPKTRRERFRLHDRTELLLPPAR